MKIQSRRSAGARFSPRPAPARMDRRRRRGKSRPGDGRVTAETHGGNAMTLRQKASLRPGRRRAGAGAPAGGRGLRPRRSCGGAAVPRPRDQGHRPVAAAAAGRAWGALPAAGPARRPRLRRRRRPCDPRALCERPDLTRGWLDAEQIAACGPSSGAERVRRARDPGHLRHPPPSRRLRRGDGHGGDVPQMLRRIPRRPAAAGLAD